MVTMRALPILMLRIWSVCALGIPILRVRLPLSIPGPVIRGTLRVGVAIIVVMMMTVMMPVGKGSGCGQQYAAPEEKDKESFLEESCHTMFLSVIPLLDVRLVTRAVCDIRATNVGILRQSWEHYPSVLVHQHPITLTIPSAGSPLKAWLTAGC